MDSDTSLDYALFQLSPRRSRCELFVSGDGKTEKLASGFLKPFITHLKVAGEQASRAVQSIKLEVERRKNSSTWFNKGTLERFVRFVSTPEVLELVHTFDTELSQLEGARKIYLQGAGDPPSGALGEHGTAAADITKKELLRAIDVRLVAVKQDLSTACARASAAGFTLDKVSELLIFADHFGAHRLKEACTRFISLCQRRPDFVCHQHLPPSLPSQWRGFDDGNIRASSGSDMSIDEPEVEPGGGKLLSNDGGGLELPKPSNSRQPKLSMAGVPAASQQVKPIPRHFVEIQAEKATEEPPAASVAEPAQQAPGEGSRRLSVQDRINLFESKRKEQTGSSNSIPGGGVSKVAAGKGEHRRLPSDVSVEKSVLRRWSGASDMSIDLNNSTNSSYNEMKGSGSAAGTPTSVNFQDQSISKTEEKEASGLKDTATSCSWSDLKECPTVTSSSSSSSLPLSQVEIKAFRKDRDHIENEGTATSSTQSGSTVEKEQGIYWKNVSMGRMENHGLNDQAASQTRVRASSQSDDCTGLKEHAAIHTQCRAISEEDVKDQAAVRIPSRAVSAVGEQVGRKDQEGSRSQPREMPSGVGVGAKEQSTLITQFRTFVSKAEDIKVKSKGPSDSRFPFKTSSGKTEGIFPESDLLIPQSQWRTPGKLEEVGVKDAAASQVPFGSLPAKPKEHSGHLGTISSRQLYAPDQIRKLPGQKDERAPEEGNAVAVFPGKRAKESMETLDSPSTSLTEQVQVVRPSKGNQELNDELQMKANELEKLFAAHKLRVQSDQMASRRSKPADVQVDHAPKAVEKRAAAPPPNQIPESNQVRENSSNGVGFDANLLLKMVDNQDYGNKIKQKLGSLSPSDDCRGKFYEKYMQKRDIKLREEWGSKRAQKEAKMKAMHDSLERSQAEMRAKFAGPAGGQDLTYSSRRAEKFRSFKASSSLKNKDQTLESIQGEEEELQEFYEQVDYSQDKSYGDNLFSDGSSKSNNSRKLPSSKSLSSTTPRTSALSLPKSSTKATKAGSVKLRTQPENPLAQSVPDFSDFRKENTQPSAGISRVNTRVRSKNFSRSKSNCEEVNLVKEDKPRRSQSMRKSSVGPCELKDLSPLNSDGANLSPARFSKDSTEPVFLNKVQKNGESKSFLRKGHHGLGPGAGAGVAKLEASMVSEVLKDGADFEEMVDQHEHSPDMVQDEEELERKSAEGNPKATDFPADSESEKPRLSQESGNFDDPGSEDGDVPRSFSQADDDMAAVSTKFNTFAGNLQASPGESPGSWNSHIQHSFSYANEASDIDASVDSATGSPASWNFHPLNQMMEAEAVRMRRKWGSAQIPMLVANASQQPRKDVTKGFKRLLKFGRKSRGVESLITDWVSASTASEGDDDTEDGRDLATRPLDDLRKSRMGYPLSSYDGSNEGEVFPEQAQSVRSSIPNAPANFKLREDHLTGSSLKAPRSFFSLSTFRSKGSESKLR